MKKQTLLLVALLISGFSFAQVGVGTTNPQTSLQVDGANAGGALTSADGVVVPRVNTNMTDGTGAANGTIVGQLVYSTNASSTGFWYWTGVTSGSGTGAFWDPVGGSGGGSTADGSETKINAGNNVSVAGSGTSASPYIVSTNFVPSTVDLGGGLTADISSSTSNAFLFESAGSGTVRVTMPDPTAPGNLGRLIIIDGSKISNSISFIPSINGNSGLSRLRSGLYYANGTRWVPIFEN